MAIQQRATSLFTRAQQLLDGVVSPDTRGQLYSKIETFSKEQPLLATFLLIQLLLTFTPIALFISFTTGILILSLLTALVFSLFWIGIALLILIPTLFITVFIGVAVWVWAVTSFLAARWVYNSVPINIAGKAEVMLPNGKKAIVKKSEPWVDGGKLKGEVVEA